MPVSVTKNPNGSYKVETPNGVHARGTSKENAEAQARLLNAVDHGWHTDGQGKKRRRLGGG
jgi:hypothetical protein